MDDVKSWITSKTVWGAALAAIGGLGVLFGYTFTAADQVDALNHVWAIVTDAGALLAIWGRVTATKKIG